MSAAPDDVVGLIAGWPEGSLRGTARTRRDIASKTTFSHGQAVKLVAEELGGNDYFSFNLYHLASGPRIFPCEMPLEKVLRFSRDFKPDQGRA